MQHPLIRLSHVGKNYPLMQQGRHRMAQVWARLKGAEPDKVFKALQDINFEVHRGQSLGLVGVNGAGKSTLLKIIAGVVKPTTGEMLCRGRIGALLELGAGFHPDYTGRDNIFLACALMGLTKSETQAKVEQILAFADIGQQIDQPIKHYSSGMVVRLGFAVATSVVPDVLITDEVLAVGDESFQKKCIAWMENFLTQGGTLLLCSHSMYHIQKLCQRAVWIDQGRMVLQGDSADVTRSYLAWHEEKTKTSKQSHYRSEVVDNSGSYHVKAMLVNSQQDEQVSMTLGSCLNVQGKIYSPDGRTPHVAVGLTRLDGSQIFGISSDMDNVVLKQGQDGLYEFSIRFEKLNLLPSIYFVRTHAMDPEGLRLFDHIERKLQVIGQTRVQGLIDLARNWV